MATLYPNAPQPVDPIEVHINHFFDRIIACVNQRRALLLAEANERRLEMAARVIERAQAEQELLNTKAEVERNIKTNELRGLQVRMLTEIEEKLSEVRLPRPEARLKFQGFSEELERLILALGDIIEEAVQVIPLYQQMERMVSIGKKGTNPGEHLYPHGVAIDHASNHIYVAEGATDFARVSIFSEMGEFLNSFTEKRMKNPWGIAFHLNNVYVTGINGVFHFKILETDIQFISALVGKGSSDGKFNDPSQMTVSGNGDLFIADCNNHRIQILDQSIHFQRSITHKTLHNPVDIKLTPNEIYILSSSDYPCVHMFTYTGDKLSSFITGDTKMRVGEAWFFCLDAEKNVIISDGLDHSIKVFSSNGTLLSLMQMFKNSGNYMNPQGIALMNFKLVVAATYDEFSLQILQ